MMCECDNHAGSRAISTQAATNPPQTAVTRPPPFPGPATARVLAAIKAGKRLEGLLKSPSGGREASGKSLERHLKILLHFGLISHLELEDILQLGDEIPGWPFSDLEVLLVLEHTGSH